MRTPFIKTPIPITELRSFFVKSYFGIGRSFFEFEVALVDYRLKYLPVVGPGEQDIRGTPAQQTLQSPGKSISGLVGYISTRGMGPCGQS
jgi:hypothetical protein